MPLAANRLLTSAVVAPLLSRTSHCPAPPPARPHRRGAATAPRDPPGHRVAGRGAHRGRLRGRSGELAAPDPVPTRRRLRGRLPRLAGAAEVLLDDADRLVERASAAGLPVTYRRGEGMWHAYPVLTGTLREANAALAELAALRADCTRP